MASHSTLDPESFQRLLSNALASQENGMDAESLTAIAELQREVATGPADLDRAMDMIALRARNVANAKGIAIGLLKGDQLVYRAGSGSGVAYVGHHVLATLCAGGHNLASGEILRVENAQTDRRIEAAICRQFEALSLLILPIYHGSTMVGVLEVLFDEAHAFQHPEVLSYRLMAALVGEVMSYAAQPEQRKPLAADPSTMRQSIQLTRPEKEPALHDHASVPSAAANRAVYPAFGTFIARAGRLPALTHSAWAALKRAKYVPWYKRRWEMAVGLAAVLVIACWIGSRDRRIAPPPVSGPLESNVPRQQMPFTPTKPVLANRASKPKTALGLKPGERKTSRFVPAQVLDGNVRVRYVSDDVTVRYFTPNPPPHPVRGRNVQVRHISDDVTVRYFTPAPQ
jgi:GAF domain-containing protein